jgi:superoxide dismutase, Fe-Mn family
MENEKNYSLPKLSYNYDELIPIISEEQLKIHYEKHHNSYVIGANSILEKLDQAKDGRELDIKSILKALSFNIGGHILHSLFWENLAPQAKGGGEIPHGKFFDAINESFGNFDNFKKRFTQTALTVEGSGWAALAYCSQTKRLLPMQIEKHNMNGFPSFKILMVVDVFEHAYYIDYTNERGKYLEEFWKIINWGEVENRFDKAIF